MENKMKRYMLLLMVALLGGTVRLAAQETVEARGITTEIKIEEVIFGHLTELNDKFKLRASEFTFAPGGYLGAHHHVGPGIRYVLSGELTFTEGGQETVYKAGEYYFILKPGTSRIPLRTRQRCRFAYWSWRFFRRTGQLRRPFHPSRNEARLLETHRP
jgi:quercetin dioxygenase-like cupin family protein